MSTNSNTNNTAAATIAADIAPHHRSRADSNSDSDNDFVHIDDFHPQTNKPTITATTMEATLPTVVEVPTPVVAAAPVAVVSEATTPVVATITPASEPGVAVQLASIVSPIASHPRVTIDDATSSDDDDEAHDDTNDRDDIIDSVILPARSPSPVVSTTDVSSSDDTATSTKEQSTINVDTVHVADEPPSLPSTAPVVSSEASSTPIVPTVSEPAKVAEVAAAAPAPVAPVVASVLVAAESVPDLLDDDTTSSTSTNDDTATATDEVEDTNNDASSLAAIKSIGDAVDRKIWDIQRVTSRLTNHIVHLIGISWRARTLIAHPLLPQIYSLSSSTSTSARAAKSMSSKLEYEVGSGSEWLFNQLMTLDNIRGSSVVRRARKDMVARIKNGIAIADDIRARAKRASLAFHSIIDRQVAKLPTPPSSPAVTPSVAPSAATLRSTGPATWSVPSFSRATHDHSDTKRTAAPSSSSSARVPPVAAASSSSSSSSSSQPSWAQALAAAVASAQQKIEEQHAAEQQRQREHDAKVAHDARLAIAAEQFRRHHAHAPAAVPSRHPYHGYHNHHAHHEHHNHHHDAALRWSPKFKSREVLDGALITSTLYGVTPSSVAIHVDTHRRLLHIRGTRIVKQRVIDHHATAIAHQQAAAQRRHHARGIHGLLSGLLGAPYHDDDEEVAPITRVVESTQWFDETLPLPVSLSTNTSLYRTSINDHTGELVIGIPRAAFQTHTHHQRHQHQPSVVLIDNTYGDDGSDDEYDDVDYQRFAHHGYRKSLYHHTSAHVAVPSSSCYARHYGGHQSPYHAYAHAPAPAAVFAW